MIKKIISVLLIFVIAQSAFATEVPNVNTDFFNRFNDDYLDCYIEQALKNNHELAQTQYKVEQYRQQMKISLGNELPSLGVSANYLGVHIPKLDNFQLQQNAFVLPFIASYEPDFLLKNRDKTRSTKKAYESAKEEQKSVYITLLSDVASGYINILQYDDLILKQTEVVKISNEDLNRTQKKFTQGTIDSTVLNSAKQTLENDKNTLINLEKQRTEILNNFAVLIGISPTEICAIKRGKLSAIEYSGSIPSDVKSDVIFARPDVMSVEKQLDKAKIDIRVARKEFLPSFNITGLWAFNTIAPGTFFSWESSLAAILAGASMDIFKGGKKIANLKLQKAKYQELFEKYRQTDLNAAKEVNTALCIIKYDTNIDDNIKKVLSYEISIYASSKKKYERGVISYPELLSAYKKLINIEQNKTRSKTTRLVNYITLYKAVGGAL